RPVEDLTRAIRTVMQGRRFLGADAARVVVLQRYLRERRVAGVPRKRWGKSEGGGARATPCPPGMGRLAPAAWSRIAVRRSSGATISCPLWTRPNSGRGGS